MYVFQRDCCFRCLLAAFALSVSWLLGVLLLLLLLSSLI
jgi:hypothetical protein